MGGPYACLTVGDDLLIGRDPGLFIYGSKFIRRKKDLVIVIGQIFYPIEVDGTRDMSSPV